MKVKLRKDSDNLAPSVSGIRMLDGDVTDMVEAGALSFRPHYVDVYLATWGPEDDGATLGGPGPLTLLALQNGVETVSDRARGREKVISVCLFRPVSKPLGVDFHV